MTTAVIVTRKGGNKAVDVIVENWFPEIPPVESGDVPHSALWKDVARQTLHNDGDSSTEIYVYDNQRVRIEEKMPDLVIETEVD